MTPKAMTLGQKIRDARINKMCLNRSHLGDMIGVSQEYIRLIEQDKRVPSYVIMQRLEEALNITLDKSFCNQFSGRGYSHSNVEDYSFEILAAKLTNIERNYVVGYMESLIDRRKP